MAKETRHYWKMRLGQKVQVKCIRAGKYCARRSDDGREFMILRSRSSKEWVIEAQDTMSVDGAPTLQSAIAGLAFRWTPQSREATDA